ncbi:MAG: hypothetical protein KGY54_03160, partial [Oleiphilaceae bacterium]|nr:hypothetical protein [Oleiphilaceae bacterium]
MSENSQTIVKRVRDKIQSLHPQNRPKTRADLDKRFRQSIHYAVGETFKHAEKKEKSAIEVADQLLDNDLNQQNVYTQFRDGIGALYAQDELIRDELNQLKTVENAQGRRNAVWRFVSTLAVGGAILVIYAVAGWLDIALPL